MSHVAFAPSARLVLPRRLLLKAAHHHEGMYSKSAGYYLLAGRWHKLKTGEKAPKGAPVAAHPQAAGQHLPAAHFTDDQWAALKLPDSNVNAPSYNKALDKLKEWSDAGNVTAIVGAGYGSNTYGQKLAKVANHLLGLHGSAHKVAAGQKSGEHAAVQSGPAEPHPSGLPEHLAPKTTQGLQEPGGMSPLAQHVKDSLDQKAADGDVEFIKLVAANNPEHPQIVAYAKQKLAELGAASTTAAAPALPDLDSPEDMAANHEAAPALAMPDFEEGKTTTGVKAYYEKVAKKVIDHGLAGNVAVLEGMKDVNGKSWQGKTANSKKLLALHKQALAYAKGGAATAVDTGPKEGDTKPAADGGTLVLKDGHWVKQVADAPAAVKPEHFEVSPGDVFKLDSQYQKMNAGEWVVYNISADGAQVYMHKVGAKVPNATNSATIPATTLAEAVAKGTAKKQTAPPATASAPAPGSLSPQQLSNLQSIPWFKLKLPAENTNAKSHNAALAKIEAMAFAGDTAGLQAFIDAKAGAKQTYAKKQVLTAQTALAGLQVQGATAAVPVQPAPALDPEQKQILDDLVAGEHWVDIEDLAQMHGPGTPLHAYAQKLLARKPTPEQLDAAAATKPAVTADTPLAPGQIAALESFSLADLKAIDSSPGLPANVQAWIDKKLPELEQAAKPIQAPKTILHNTMPGHSKSWSVYVAPNASGGFDMVTEYGKIGGTQQKTVKSYATAGEANTAAIALKNEKFKKGYVQQPTDFGHAVPAPGAAAQPAGPKEGDTKQGADGLLVLKNGHWVKVGGNPTLIDGWKASIAAGKTPTKAQAEAMAALEDSDPDEYMDAFMEAVNGSIPAELKTDDSFDDALEAFNQKAHSLHAAALASALSAGAAPWNTPAVDAAPSMDAWTKIGEQGGSNPGGKFRDPSGQEWYCKWPSDPEAIASEVLAAKLYALAGLSSQDCMVVTKGGKPAIATKWVNIKKAGTAAALAKIPGALDGFAVDAWLGNWDVVGMSLDNLQVGPDGKAHRVDAGGSLEYRAQGAKKPFGAKVDEIDTLRDAAKNPHAAAVFSGIKQTDLIASVAKVAAISDVAIRAMVNEFGPGDAAAKKKLADTLIARKKDLLTRFPKAAKAKKKPTFDPSQISAPPSFLNWGGSGKSGPSSKEFLNKANEDAVQSIFAAAKTGSMDAVKNLMAPVFDKDTGQVTGHKPVLDHPSQHVKGYAQQAINEINYQLNPPKKFRFDGGHPLHALNNAYPAHKGATSSSTAQKLGKFIVLGEPGSVKLEEAGLPDKITHSEGGGLLSRQTYKAQAHAAWHKMPKTQRDAIKAYTGSSYKSMNSSLWSGNPTGAAKAASEAIHTLGHDIQPGTVLSRHIDTTKFAPGEVEKLLASTGKVLQEPAIMSTSIRPSSWVRSIQFKLHVGPGVKGLWVGPGSEPGGGAISVNSGEDELLLPPNTRLMILSVKHASGNDPDGFGKHGQKHLIEAIILPTN